MRRTYLLLTGGVLVGTLTACVSAFGQGPTPVDTTGNSMGLLPGPFPTSVTAANVGIEQFTPSELGGGGSDSFRITFPSAGPMKWTSSRHNEGDFALSISPGGDGPEYFPPNAFVDDRKPLEGGQPFSESTIAWRVNQLTGGLLATVRHNGVDNGPDFTFGGTPVGVIHGVAYFNQDFAQGWGFNMADGTFGNGGGGASDLMMGIAGYDGGKGESGSNVATAYFPYEQGWTGAWVNGGDEGEGAFAASTTGLPTTSVTWSASQANVKLPGVNSATDGMLFVAPSHGDNLTNIAAAFPNGDGGWTVSVREDEDFDFTGQTVLDSSQNEFQFVYIPYTAHNLIGGQVQGSDGSLTHSAGDQFFDLTRNAAGEYALSVFDSDGTTKLNEGDGMLVLSVAKSMDGAPSFADRSFMSYEYDAESGDFIIQSRQITANNSPQSENQFGELLSLTDTNFYFAWVDFTNPLSPTAPSLPGDYNDNGVVDAADYTVWRDKLGTTEELPNDDIGGTIGADQYTQWKTNFGNSSGSGAGMLGGAAVPEPSTLALGTLLGAIVAGTLRRRS